MNQKKVNKWILEESKFGRTKTGEFPIITDVSYPEGRLKLAPHSVSKTLVQSSLSGLKNQRMEFRTATDPGKLGKWKLKKKKTRK